ncbi:hypothetical protein HPP92_028356 [Vanilla planifolia]|uniref:Uncharacterized protein n=1 Tax=Vanilla planifolia TaxID=51239 RepID=A0A835P7N8_VANPL|nr:hypothetical protein HPP92_028356 [Vanilla planifolia]
MHLRSQRGDVDATGSSEKQVKRAKLRAVILQGKTDVKTVPKQRGTGISVDRKSSNSRFANLMATKSPSKNHHLLNHPKLSRIIQAKRSLPEEACQVPKGSKSRRQVKDNSSGKRKRLLSEIIGSPVKQRQISGRPFATFLNILKDARDAL